MTAILITGYQSFELGIFSSKDQRISIIKTAIRKDLINYLEEGVDWFIFTGNLGFEQWALEVVNDLKTEYPLQVAT
ncbi:SLOG family protein, partial [Streptococcus dysgalactiae]